jgi:hypothetical protein
VYVIIPNSEDIHFLMWVTVHVRTILFAYFFSRTDSGLVQNPRFVYTVELDIEECLKQKPSMKSFLSRLRDKPSKLEFSKVRWAPLDLIYRLARADESLSSSDTRTKSGVSQENLLGQSGASRPGIGQIFLLRILQVAILWT